MKRYSEDIECILPSSDGIGALYISNLEAAQNLYILNKYKIKAVITICRGHMLKHKTEELPYYLYFPADDHQSFYISKYFEEAAQFIEKKRRKTNVLVHCMAGISRSVTLVLAYLIKTQGHTTQTAYSLVKKQRRKIYPNSGFMKQLKKYQQKIQQQTKQCSLQIGRLSSLKTSMVTNSQFKNNKYSDFSLNVYNPRPLSSIKCSLVNNQFVKQSIFQSYLSSKQTKRQLNPLFKSLSKTIYENSKENTFKPCSFYSKSKINNPIQKYDQKLKQDIKKLRSENFELKQSLNNRNNYSRKPMSEIFYGN